jgi:hypothetical protein
LSLDDERTNERQTIGGVKTRFEGQLVRLRTCVVQIKKWLKHNLKKSCCCPRSFINIFFNYFNAKKSLWCISCVTFVQTRFEYEVWKSKIINEKKEKRIYLIIADFCTFITFLTFKFVYCLNVFETCFTC